MNDSKNLMIGVLTITATILVAAVILSTMGPRNEAMAIGQLDRGGDYIVLTGQFTENNELVYITDAAAQRTNVYSYEPTTRQFALWDSIDLQKVMGSIRR
jgi:ethanolamine utilization microcompartment shell protein EutS